MRRVECTITFTDDEGTPRKQIHHLQTPRAGNPAGEHRVAHHIFADFQVAMRAYAVPKHNATAPEHYESDGKESRIKPNWRMHQRTIFSESAQRNVLPTVNFGWDRHRKHCTQTNKAS